MPQPYQRLGHLLLWRFPGREFCAMMRGVTKTALGAPEDPRRCHSCPALLRPEWLRRPLTPAEQTALAAQFAELEANLHRLYERSRRAT